MKIERPNPIPGGLDQITYTRDANGLRGVSGSLSEIDILTVGGSTTDQRFLDDTQTFQAVLRDLFKAEGRDVSIANAGIDGQSTFGHIENFTSWFNLIDGLQARYVLYYVGINDALIIAENTRFDRLERTGGVTFKDLIKQKSAFYQVYTIAKGIVQKPEIAHIFNQKNLALAPPYETQPMLPDAVWAGDDIRADLSALQTRIETLADLTRNFGAEPIFVTQRGAVWRRLNGKVVGSPSLEPGFHLPLEERLGELNGVDIYRIQRAFADAVLAGCERSDAICLDLVADVDFEIAEDFYDELHTTAHGSARIADYLFAAFKQLGLP